MVNNAQGESLGANRQNAWKGLLFGAHVRHEMMMSGFAVAKPEPDRGEDLWFAISDDGGSPALIHRAQLKSAYIPERAKRKWYLINIIEEDFLKHQGDPSYIYIFGLAFNSQSQATPRRDFHVGSFSNAEIQGLLKRDILGRPPTGKDMRQRLTFRFNVKDGGGKREVWLKSTLNVTQRFEKWLDRLTETCRKNDGRHH